MGNCLRPKVEKIVTELTEENLILLEANTNLDRSTILEWHKNFLVIFFKFFFYICEGMCCG